MLEFIEKKIDHLRYPYLVVVVLTHVLYFVAVFGIIQIKQEYIHWLSVAIQTFIALFLLVRFHPFRKRLAEIREVDNGAMRGRLCGYASCDLSDYGIGDRGGWGRAGAGQPAAGGGDCGGAAAGGGEGVEGYETAAGED
jgi:hypothetical protein